MKIRTDVILRLRDHLLEPASPSAAHAFTASELADAVMKRIDPFAEVMYLVIAADDVIDPSERSALLSALDILCDGTVSTDALSDLLSRLETVRPGGADPERRLAAATARIGQDRENRETAFLLAAAVALADDEFEPREARVMDWARTYLGISPRRLEALLASAGEPQPR